MKKSKNDVTQLNETWVLHCEELDPEEGGRCYLYVLLEAKTGYCLSEELSVDLPPEAQLRALFNAANAAATEWPQKLYLLSKEPLKDVIQKICDDLHIQTGSISKKEMAQCNQDFKKSLTQFFNQNNDEELELSENSKAMVPDSYDPCPCASGKKFRFCCQKSFKDVVFALCAAQENNLDEALMYMAKAEKKVGRTAEILCRYAICWSFYDKKKTKEYLDEALKLNPNHPRSNYLLGIEAVDNKDYKKAVQFYMKAIEHYPVEDKFHLNETYNNIGSAYYNMNKYMAAKEAWEKALLILPTDNVVKNNLLKLIYYNPHLPKNIRKISPLIAKFL